MPQKSLQYPNLELCVCKAEDSKTPIFNKMSTRKRKTLLHIVFFLALSIVAARSQYIFTTNTDGSLNIDGYVGPGGTIAIPDTTNGVPIVSIDPYAFRFTRVTNVTVGDNITGIGEGAFYGCPGLKIVNLDTNLGYIGFEAFYQCPNLAQVIIPDSVTNINNTAFENCTNVHSIVIGNGVVAIGDNTFQGCIALTNLVLGTNLVSIGWSAFGHNPNLKNVIIPDSVTGIAGDEFFQCTGLTNAVIGNGATNLFANTFYSCTNLVTVTFGTNLTNIAFGAFTGDPAIRKLYFAGNAPGVNTNEFRFEPAIVYYLPWTTGWTAMFGGAQTAPWLPQAANTGFNYSSQTNQFGFTIDWASGQTVIVDTCTNLSSANWIPVATNLINSGSVKFSDPTWEYFPNRYYRIRSQ